MLDPAYFIQPLTYLNTKHPRHGERNLEQRPLKPTSREPSPKPCANHADNGGTNCRAA